ncbi:hypothetical protein [Streptomyces sp. NPDC048636]|uniref:hypothetical protein n=1 Tax=Streptomyces sp. NPDC048636 TaxID=3155762 RepID=UPI00342F7B5A
MDDVTDPMNEPLEEPSAEPRGDEVGAFPTAGVDGEDEQADRIRQLRERGLPLTLVEGALKSGAIGFGSGDAAKTMYKIHYGAPTGEPAIDGRCPEEELDSRRARYVRPSSHDALVAHLSKYWVAVLRGAPGSGRFTTALLAVREVMDTGVILLDAKAGARRLVNEGKGLQATRGHVVEGGDSVWAAELTAQLLTRLREATYRRSPLVIIIDDQLPVTGLEGHVVEHEAPDELRSQVLNRHLTVLLEDHPEGCRKLLEHERLKADLRGRRSMAQIARLAGQLARRLRNGDDADQIVEGLGAELRAKAERLLSLPKLGSGDSKKPDMSLWSRAFLLACVVLDGSTLSRVSRESHRLAELLYGVRSPSSVPEMPLFEESLSDWLNHSEVEFTDHAGLLVEPRHPECLVQMRQPGLGEAVMEVLWHDHSGARWPLLEWLDSLVLRSEEDIRVAAAQTVGLLTTFDWAYVHEELLVRWASEKGEHEESKRFAAAWALERAVVIDPLLAPRVRQLLSRWSQLREFKDCAQAAYGTSIGAMFPTESLSNLERIAESRMQSVWTAVREIYAAGSREQVLERLAHWSASPRYRLRDDAARCLHRLSKFRGERAVIPFLGNPGSRAHLLLLTRQTLLSRTSLHRRWGWDAMRLWVERAEDAPGLDELVAHFIADLPEPGVEGNDLREQFLFYLRLWSYQLRGSGVAARIKSLVRERWSM